MSKTAEKFEFQAEVSQVLDLVIHSLYSNKEIFLRELISNASDACDKLRFEAIKNDALAADDLRIRVDVDSAAGTVTVSDNGIGMTRQEVIKNIGTIANSGTRKYLEKIAAKDRADANLIGQFGVGFYSAFIVADKVELRTLKAGKKQAVQWTSDGKNAFTLEPCDKDTHGTEVILHLRKDAEEFLSDYKLRALIKKYSEHVVFPIQMIKPAEADATAEEQKTDTPEYEIINDAQAIWKKSPGDLKDEDYQSFYKQISHDFNDAWTWSHNHIEGAQSYSNLLYIPSKSPFSMFQNPEDREGLKLYIKRVFIMDASKELLPNYLRFVKGVVDSADLPLNVSREILQDNPLLAKIRAGLVKRVLGMLKKKASAEATEYQNFWQEFGTTLKEGVVEDFANREAILKLLRFSSTQDDSEDAKVSLDDYVARMPGDQEKIYYITGESHQAVKHSPQLEYFRKKGIEVLLMHERIDEWMMGHVQEYDGKTMQSVAKGQLQIDDDEKTPQPDEAQQSLLEKIKQRLSEKVSDVVASKRLVDSASCLVLSEHEMALHLQKLMEQAGQKMPGSLPTLEINLTHPLVQHVGGIEDEDKFARWADLLYQQALLAEGVALENPAEYVRNINALLLDVMA